MIIPEHFQKFECGDATANNSLFFFPFLKVNNPIVDLGILCQKFLDAFDVAFSGDRSSKNQNLIFHVF